MATSLILEGLIGVLATGLEDYDPRSLLEDVEAKAPSEQRALRRSQTGLARGALRRFRLQRL